MKDSFYSTFCYFSVTDYGKQFISDHTTFPFELSISDLLGEKEINNGRRYVMRTREGNVQLDKKHGFLEM